MEMKLLIYYNINSGRYYMKNKAVFVDDLQVVTSQGHILVAVFTLRKNIKLPLKYRLGLYFERLAIKLKSGIVK